MKKTQGKADPQKGEANDKKSVYGIGFTV